MKSQTHNSVIFASCKRMTINIYPTVRQIRLILSISLQCRNMSNSRHPLMGPSIRQSFAWLCHRTSPITLVPKRGRARAFGLRVPAPTQDTTLAGPAAIIRRSREGWWLSTALHLASFILSEFYILLTLIRQRLAVHSL